jgi:TP901 family phage tail tape measure protein
MTTIAKLVIEARADPSGVRAGLLEAERLIQRFKQAANAKANLDLNLPGASKQINEAQKVLSRIQADFADTRTRLREDAARGILDPKALQVETANAMKLFDQEILKGMDALKQRGLLSPQVRQAFVEQLKTVGTNAGNAVSSATKRAIAASPLLGNLTTTGQRAANQLITGLRSTIDAQIGDLRTKFAENAISVSAFRRQSLAAANAFDKGLAEGLRDLQARGLATKNITEAITQELRLAGTKAANAFQESARRQLGGNLMQVGGTMTALLTVPILGAAVAATKLAADFDLSMRRVRVTLGATDDQFAALNKQARDLGASTQFSANDIAEAMIALGKQSLTVTQVMAAIPSTVNLAAATLTNVGDAARVAAIAVRNTATPFDQFASVTDKLTFLANKFDGSLSELETSFRTVGPVATATGQDFDTIAAAMATLAQAGQVGSVGATALRGLLTRLIDPSKKARQALEDLGVKVEDPIKGMRNLTDIIEDFQRAKVGKKGQFDEFLKDLSTIAENRTVVALTTLINKGGEGLRQMQKDINDTGGVAQQFADVQMQGLIGAFRQFENVMQEVGLTAIADTGLSKALREIVLSAAAALKVVSELNPTVLKIGIIFAGVAAAIGPLVLGVGLLVTTFAALQAIMLQMNVTFSAGAFIAAMAKGSLLLVGILAVATAIGFLTQKMLESKVAMAEFQGQVASKSQESLEGLKKEILTKIEFYQGMLRVVGGKITEMASGKLAFENERTQGKKIREIANVIQQLKSQLSIVDTALQQRTTTNAELATQAAADRLRIEAEVAALLAEFNKNKALGGGGDDAIKKIVDNASEAIGLVQALNAKFLEAPEPVHDLESALNNVNKALALGDKLTRAQRISLLNVKNQAVEALKNVDYTPVPDFEALQRTLQLHPPLQIKVTPVGAEIELDTFDVELRKVFDAAMRHAERAKVNLDLAKIIGDQELIASSTKKFESSMESAEKAQKMLAVALLMSNVPYERRAEVLKEIIDRTKELKDKEEKLQEKLRKIRNDFDAFRSASKGVQKLASAFGLVNDQLEQFLSQIGDAVDGLEQFFIARASGSMFGQITAAVGVVASLVSAFKALREGDPQNDKIRDANTEALVKLRLEIRGWTQSVGNLQKINTSFREITLDPEFLKAMKQLRGGLGDAVKSAVAEVLQLQAVMQNTGLSKKELEEIASRFDITLFNDKGNLVAGTLDQLHEAIQLTIRQLTTFGTSLQDVQNINDIRKDLFNIPETPASLIQEQLDIIKDFAPALFTKFFDGLSPVTEEGRAKIEQAFQRLFEFIADEGLFKDPLLLDKFTGIEDVLEIIKNFASAMDDARESAEEVAKELLNVPAGFKIERARFLATMTEAMEQAAIRNIPPLPVRPQTPVGIGTTTSLIPGTVMRAITSSQPTSVVYNFTDGAITVDAKNKTSEEIFDAVRGVARQKARALGPLAKAADTLEY